MCKERVRIIHEAFLGLLLHAVAPGHIALWAVAAAHLFADATIGPSYLTCPSFLDELILENWYPGDEILPSIDCWLNAVPCMVT